MTQLEVWSDPNKVHTAWNDNFLLAMQFNVPRTCSKVAVWFLIYVIYLRTLSVSHSFNHECDVHVSKFTKIKLLRNFKDM